MYASHVHRWLLLAGLSACTDVGPNEPIERVELRACNETGADMTRFWWALTDDKPLRSLQCTDYRTSDTDVCDETFVAFDIDGETYSTQRIDCYRGDYGVYDGRWTVHVTIGSREHHVAEVNVTRD